MDNFQMNSQVVSDLELVTVYAARAGLLQKDDPAADMVEKAKQALASGTQPNMPALVKTLNRLVKNIAPITLADLRSERDPYSPANQAKAKNLQILLAIFSMVVLMLIGYLMNALHKEQTTVAVLQELQDLKPQEKITSLRKMAQRDHPFSAQNTINDNFSQKKFELRNIQSRIHDSYVQAKEACNQPMFPWLGLSLFPDLGCSTSGEYNAPQGPERKVSFLENNPSEGGFEKAFFTNDKNKKDIAVQNANEPEPTNKLRVDNTYNILASDPCIVDSKGELQLPKSAERSPAWLQPIALDGLSDYCFELAILPANGRGSIQTENFSTITFIPALNEKISLRADWFLPFLYGLLGASLFMIRNIYDHRTPASDWLPAMMRVSLGGIAGIVVGWFFATPSHPAFGSVSFPFALAFVTGYGIDVLFNLLDRLNKTISDLSNHKRP